MQILEGSPWLQSRPVFVLATQQRNSDQGLTYTLRVRVSKPEAESEISRVSRLRGICSQAVSACNMHSHAQPATGDREQLVVVVKG